MGVPQNHSSVKRPSGRYIVHQLIFWIYLTVALKFPLISIVHSKFPSKSKSAIFPSYVLHREIKRCADPVGVDKENLQKSFNLQNIL